MIYMKGYDMYMDYPKFLRSKGFTLNSYPEGKFWELVVEDSEEQKEHICNIFKADIDLYVHGADIETLILQCAEDFKGASFIMTAIPGIWIQKNGLSALNKFR